MESKKEQTEVQKKLSDIRKQMRDLKKVEKLEREIAVKRAQLKKLKQELGL